MTRYMLGIYHPDGPIPEPERLAVIMAELEVVNAEMRAAGAWVFAGGLAAASSATVVRFDGKDQMVTDGPFAEGKEHLGGFTVIEAADLDEAMTWASRYARVLAPVSIEVRPFVG
ncbi:YciI family protein [Kibdelosporangium lantanae]